MSSLPAKLCTSLHNSIERSFISHSHLIINDADGCSPRGSSSVPPPPTTATTASPPTEKTPSLVCLEFLATLEMLSEGTNNNGQIPSKVSSLFRSFSFLSSVAHFALRPVGKCWRLPPSGPSCPLITALAASLSE